MSTAEQERTVRAVAEIRAALSGCDDALAFLRGRVEDPAALAALHDLLLYRGLDAVDAVLTAERARLHAAELAAYEERKAA